jgi:hypothetical protein
MGKGNTDSARRLGLLAVAAVLAGAVALAGKRLAAGGGGPRADTYTCGCGAEYGVTGIDRHRVYWQEGEAVMGDRCVACDRPLPSGHDVAVV